MKILRVEVGNWRNLRDVALDIPDDATLVCLVGENGTGKSTLLELLSTVALHVGLSPGVGSSRGDPFSEADEVSVFVRIPTDDLPETVALLEQLGISWSGDLLVQKTSGTGLSVSASGVDFPNSNTVAQAAIVELRRKSETQHLFLDADRAYPPTAFNQQHYMEILSQDYRDPFVNRQQSSRPSRTLYEDWIKYLVGIEERTSTQFFIETRSARASGNGDPVLIDPFDNYRILLSQTLPHLRFTGIESSGVNRTVQFDSAGKNLSFGQLSGGEREIAFLTAQIDRFRLQRGLLLVDEPELHLNPDLLRQWLVFLRDTMKDGQVWFATHSLEAVEVAGPEATFVFERDPLTRLVHNPRHLAGRPVLSALSAAIGSPAFSIAKLRFVLVEGDRQTRERERFFSVCGEPGLNRFLESGGCAEVLRRLEAISELARETDERLRVGGVIDRDFRTPSEVASLELKHGIHVLGCHEIENLFLHPPSVDTLLGRTGVSSMSADELIRDVGDKFAGLWIVDFAMSLQSVSVPREAKGPLSGLGRDQTNADWSNLKAASVAIVDVVTRSEWERNLDFARAEFETLRLNPDWWKVCLGKQTLSSIATPIGLSSSAVLEYQVVRLWGNEVPVPQEVSDLRAYVDSLT